MKKIIFIAAMLPSILLAKTQNSVSVSGECHTNVYPDQMQIHYNVEILEKSHEASNSKASKIYNELKKQIEDKDLSDEEISTTHYTTQPYRPWENGKEVFKGYQTTIGLKVQTSTLKETASLLELAVGKEGTRASGPEAIVSRALHKKTYNDCLEKATQDAEVKAKRLAKSFSMEIGNPLKIVEQGGSAPGPRPYYAKAMMMDASSGRAESAQVSYGKEEISVNVNVEFELK